MDLLKNNLGFASGLDKSKQAIYRAFVQDCFNKNLLFQVTEGLRTYQRQCLLLSQGRTIDDINRNVFLGGFKLSTSQMQDMLDVYKKNFNLQGSIVTHTLTSKHLKGLAVDLYPKNCSYSDIESVSFHYGIAHPYLVDQAHFDLTNAKMPPPEPTPQSKVHDLVERINQVSEPSLKEQLLNQLQRLRNRLHL